MSGEVKWYFYMCIIIIITCIWFNILYFVRRDNMFFTSAHCLSQADVTKRLRVNTSRYSMFLTAKLVKFEDF
jgi:hypothetical protein